MQTFHITHRDKQGIEHEYDGIFKCAIDAVSDCIKTFGFGRVKAIPLNQEAANQEMPRAA